jgi:hypothetical protein
MLLDVVKTIQRVTAVARRHGPVCAMTGVARMRSTARVARRWRSRRARQQDLRLLSARLGVVHDDQPRRIDPDQCLDRAHPRGPR